MEANETDFPYVPPKEIVEEQVAGIAGGIMDLLENPDPNYSAPAVSRPATEEETKPSKPEEEEGEEEGEEEPTGPKQAVSEVSAKFKIKWQGQEKEVTQAELVDLAQKGFDYTKKTQALAQERDQLAPYQGLANLLQADPARAQQIAAILSGQSIQKEPEKPRFDDPIEQLKWETKQETIGEIRKELAETIAPLHHQQALNQVKWAVQSDPDYNEIHQEIIKMVLSQPPALQKTLHLQLDQDPQTYLEAFQFYKQKLALNPGTPKPQAIKKETKAPFLDAGGVAAPAGIEGKERRQRLSKQKVAALRTGDPMAIGKWLEDSGAIDHLY